MTFLAAILEEQHKPLVLRQLEVPADLYCGQVLVKIIASGICGAQLSEINGIKGIDKYLPHCLGHEGSGVVIASGPGVKSVKPGDRVIIHWRKGTGIDAELPKYWCPELNKYIGGGANTTFQEYSVISENRLTKIPKTIAFEEAALLGCAVTTGLGIVSNELYIKMGQSVAVIGCGGVGLNVIQGCSLVSAYPIVGIDILQTKLWKAISMGATQTINSTEHAITAQYDVVIDTTGKASVMKQAWEMTKAGGTLCLVAQLKHDQHMELQTLPMHSGKRIIGSDGGGTDPTRDIPRYLNLYFAGRLNLKQLITHRAPLKDINMLMDKVRAGVVGRAIIEL